MISTDPFSLASILGRLQAACCMETALKGRRFQTELLFSRSSRTAPGGLQLANSKAVGLEQAAVRGT
jgi:hypothetical protein